MLPVAARVKFEKRATAYDASWASGTGEFWVSKSNKAVVRDYVRGLAATRLKAASIGGEQESGFEQAFSSLGYAYLKDKSPRLLDFMVGFQLVDRNEDNTKAMGIFGFHVGDQWLYAPIFFLNGDLKGHELLYLKKSDTFVPMKENWVNYIISQKPHQLGEGSDQNTQQLGGLLPNLHRMVHPPGVSKYGGDADAAEEAAKREALKSKLPHVKEGMHHCKTCRAKYYTMDKAAACHGTPVAVRGMAKKASAETVPVVPNVSPWAWPFMSFVAAGATVEPLKGKGYERFFAKHASVAASLDLRKFLGGNIAFLKAAYDLYTSYPLIKQGFDRFYGGLDFFKDAAENCRLAEQSLFKRADFDTDDPADIQARSTALDDILNGKFRRKKKPTYKRAGSLLPDAPPFVHPIKSGELKVHVYDDLTITQNVQELSEEDREKLLQDTVLIKDERDPHAQSTVYNTQVRAELSSPSDTGLYDVLEKPGSFDEMLVIMHPHTNAGSERFCTVLRLSDPRNWLNTHPTNLWVQQNRKPDKPDFNKWFKDQSSATLEKGGHYLFVGPNGSGTTPFIVRETLDDGSYKVDFKSYCEFGKDRPSFFPSYRTSSWDSMGDEYVSKYDAILRLNTRKGTQLRAVSGELSVPDTFKAIKLQDPPKPKKRDEDSLLSCCGPSSESAGSEKRPIAPGNLSDIQLMLFEKTASMKLIHVGGSELFIKSPLGEERLQKKAALLSLVTRHGLSEAAARELIKEAQLKKSFTCRIKYAQGFGPIGGNMTRSAPGAPAFPEAEHGMEQVGNNSYQSIHAQEELQPVPEMSADQTDPSIYDPFYQPDQGAMQVAQQAAQSGQKEVFDTAMISGMLKAVRQDSIVDRYLGDLMKALDKLARIMFMFYWHQEEFEDRYGKQDLPELEDSIRNAFETLGDVVLFLKEKSVGSISDFGSGVGPSEPSVEEAARN